jgi:hypothetical protein
MAKNVVNRLSNGRGVMSKVVTQNSGKLVQDCIDEIKRNADAVRGKGYASKKKKPK